MDKIERGHAAEALLQNSLLRDVLAGLEAGYTAAWRTAATIEAREDCHRHVRLIEKLAADISSIAHTGQLEQARIKELEGRRAHLWPIR
jgi:hypothetical protein